MIEKNVRLEYISDKIRKGESVDMSDAIEAILYQQKIQEEKVLPLYRRVINKLRVIWTLPGEEI